MRTIKTKYISYKNNSFLFTEDNWKSFRISNQETPGASYVLEKDQDKALEVKLRHKYGRLAASFIINEFERIKEEYCALTGEELPSKTGYGEPFEIMAISVLHSVSTENVINKYIVKGSKDGKIDAIYYNEKECVVYQIKIGVVNDNVLDVMGERINSYVDGSLSKEQACSDLQAFLDGMNPNIKNVHNIVYKTISANGKKISNTDSSLVFELFIKNSLIQSPPYGDLIIRKKINKRTYVSSCDKKVFFMFADANELIEDLSVFAKNNGADSIYSNNVRGSLGENAEMMATIKNEPSMFCAYNNGISITGSFACPEGDAFNIEIKNPNIINGQQTLFNLALARNKGISLDGVVVPLFIKNEADSQEQSRIARYNNSQRSISAVDLLSIDGHLRDLQAALLEKDIKDGFYLNLLSSGRHISLENAKKLFRKDRIIKLSDFIKLFSVIEAPQDLGKWKNSFNAQIEILYANGFPSCDVNKAKKICNIISASKGIVSLDRSKYAIADLAIQYLLWLGCSEEDAISIIDAITKDGMSRGVKAADIYKKNSIFDKVTAEFEKTKKARGK